MHRTLVVSEQQKPGNLIHAARAADATNATSAISRYRAGRVVSSDDQGSVHERRHERHAVIA